MCAIYLFSALLSDFLFSFMTTNLIVFGIENVNGDPGAPIIMLIGFLFICGVLGTLTAIFTPSMEENFEGRFHRELTAKSSGIAFLVMYLPFHIMGIFFNSGKLDFLAIPSVILLLLSYVPFYFMITKSFVHLYELLKERIF